MAEKKIKITQIKSSIGYRLKASATLEALGIKKMNHSVVKVDNPAIRGMINTVAHLVKIEEVS
ncbi:MAG: 50S ribosomal protein L30 [Candidatus Marinimicrobia bacterium]|nr:50S ribosomal protein L30 [Candidatus Neomarinimicrobiota bacterium]